MFVPCLTPNQVHFHRGQNPAAPQVHFLANQVTRGARVAGAHLIGSSLLQSLVGNFKQGQEMLKGSHVHAPVTPQSHLSHTSVTPRSHLSHTSVTLRSNLSHTSVTPRSHLGLHLGHTSVTPQSHLLVSPPSHLLVTPQSHLGHTSVTLDNS